MAEPVQVYDGDGVEHHLRYVMCWRGSHDEMFKGFDKERVLFTSSTEEAKQFDSEQRIYDFVAFHWDGPVAEQPWRYWEPMPLQVRA